MGYINGLEVYGSCQINKWPQQSSQSVSTLNPYFAAFAPKANMFFHQWWHYNGLGFVYIRKMSFLMSLAYTTKYYVSLMNIINVEHMCGKLFDVRIRYALVATKGSREKEKQIVIECYISTTSYLSLHIYRVIILDCSCIIKCLNIEVVIVLCIMHYQEIWMWCKTPKTIFTIIFNILSFDSNSQRDMTLTRWKRQI